MDYFKNKKVLVTGAGGFIGSNLVEKLVGEGAQVSAFVHYNALNSWGNLELLEPSVLSKVKVMAGDLADPFYVDSAVKGNEVVFHLGALIGIPYSYVAPQHYVSTNILGTVNILQACRNHGVKKVVHTSTSETYGTAIYTPIDEKHPMQGQSPYSASKIAADMMAESYFRSFELPVAVCRPFNTFGPRQSVRAVIPTMIVQALNGKKRIKLGSLSPYRDFNFVQDTVDGFLAIAASKISAGEVINLGSGKCVSIGETWELIKKITGSNAEVEHDEDRVRPEKSEVMKLEADSRKALALTGWKSACTLEQGLSLTVAWFRNHLNRYKDNIYTI